MDQEIWSKLVNAARDAEIELRKVSFDTMRPPIPVATYNRLVANAYGRIMELEAKVAAIYESAYGSSTVNVKAKALVAGGGTELKGPIAGAFQTSAEGKSASAK